MPLAIERFWDVESLGIKESPESNEDDEAFQQFYWTLQYKDNRYVLNWPYKGLNKVVSDNYQLCYFRLKSVLNRLKFDNLLVKYNDIIKGQLPEGIIKEVKSNQECSKVSCLPYHPVVTPGKPTTKVRIVYDASAKSGTNTLS